MNQQKNPDFSISMILRQHRAVGYGLLLFSFCISMLSIVPTIYMLQLFERVMQSRSEATLLYLSLIAALLLVIWTMLEAIRVRVLQRLAVAVDRKIGPPLFARLNRQTDALPDAARQMVLRDGQVLRDFISSPLVVQALDFLFAPIFVLVAFLFHWILGAALLAIMIVIAGLTILHQRLIGADTLRAQKAQGDAQQFGRAVMQSAEPIRVMGMLPVMTRRWRDLQDDVQGWQEEANRRAAMTAGALRFLRHAYPVMMMGVGVLLFLEQFVGAGAIFAAQLLATRAVHPVDAVLSNARSYWQVRQAVERLDTVLGGVAARPARTPLPRPDGALVVSRVTLTPPHREAVVLSDVSFTIQPGRILGVVGPSGAGKSSLARLLVGAWRPRRGQVVLGGNDLAHHDQDRLGAAIGYVPQDVLMLPGTARDNIARFDSGDGARDGADERLHRAIRLAGVGDLIQSLPDGLSTDLGPDGHALSGGQRQRLALARAVYGDPHLIVLDEPNANLDAVGEESLAATLSALRDQGAIVVVITHRMNMLAWCDDVLVLNAGTVHAFGRRDQVLSRLPGYRAPQRLTGEKA
jgi:PrtD family type I secretion system ABC transporter